MDLIALFARNILEPILAAREGSNHMSLLAELEASQYGSPEQLRLLQLERLQKILIHAEEHCPFYSEYFASYGFDPRQVTSSEDLLKLPPITKADIQKNRDRMIARNVSPDEMVLNQTGGSTGAPLKFMIDRARLFSRKASTYRHDRWVGWNIGYKMAVLWGNPLDFNATPSFKERLRSSLYDRRLMLDTGSLSVDSCQAFIEQLRNFRPPVYLAYANAIYLLARFIREHRPANYHRPKAIITSAELLLDEQRQVIEDVFECPVYNRYGCREMGMIASECEEHTGMHIAAEQILVQWLPPVTDEAGAARPIVLTDLMNRAMPLIRYRIEDMGRPLDGECGCGRTLPRMEIVGGRTTDFLVTPEGRVVSGIALALPFVSEVPGVARVQLVQKKKDMLIIRVVPGDTFGAATAESIEQKVLEYFGPRMRFEVQKVAEIEVSKSGKHRLSICELDAMEFLG